MTIKIKQWNTLTNYPFECAFELSADSEKQCTKRLFVRGCVLEHNASTLELLRHEKREEDGRGVGWKRRKHNFQSHVFRALTIRTGTRTKVHYERSDGTSCAFAVCFVFLPLALVCASLPGRRHMVMLTAAFLVRSTYLCNKDRWISDWYLGALWTERPHTDSNHIFKTLATLGWICS